MNMKKLLHAALALALTFALIVSSLVFVANAEGTTNVSNYEDFVAAVADSTVKVIEITGDFTLTDNVTFQRSLVVNGNGHTLTNGKFWCTGSNTLTFNNLNRVSTTNVLYSLADSVNVNICGGTLKGSETGSGNEIIWVQSTTTENSLLTLKDGVLIDATYNGGKNMAINFSSGASASLIIEDATLKTNSNVIKHRTFGKITILGGTLTTSADKSALITTDSSKENGQLTIGRPDGTGPTFKLTNSSNSEEIFWLTGSQEYVGHIVYGGTFEAAGAAEIFNFGKSSGLIIKGGTFTNGGASALINNNDNSGVALNINIEGGDFRPNSAGKVINTNSTSSVVAIKGGNFVKGTGDAFTCAGNLRVSGGTFNFNPQNNVIFKYKTVKSGNSWTIAENTLPAATSVSTFSDLQTKLADSSVKHIRIDAAINLTSSITINRDVYIDGNNKALTGSQIIVTGDGADVTLKNFNFSRSGDTLNIKGSADVTIIGGEISLNHTKDGNEGAIYVEWFRGVLTITGDAKIKSTTWILYTGSNKVSGGGLIKLIDCTLEKVSGNDYKPKAIWKRSNVVMEFGGGTSGQEVIFSNSDELIYASENHGGAINIKDGAKFTQTGTDTDVACIHVTKNFGINILGGTFNTNKSRLFLLNNLGTVVNIYGGTFTQASGANNLIRVERYSDSSNVEDANGVHLAIHGGTFNTYNYIMHSSNSGIGYYLTINGGTFKALSARILRSAQANRIIVVNGGTFTSAESTDPVEIYDTGAMIIINGGTWNMVKNATVFQKKNGTLIITGGTFNLVGSSVVDTVKNNPNGNLTIDNTNGNITVNGNQPLLRHESTAPVNIIGFEHESDTKIIYVSSTGGDITLTDCNIKSNEESAIVSESTANINIVDTIVESASSDAISGTGNVVPSGDYEIRNKTNLHEFARLINEAAANSTVRITQDYTNVPAVIIDKNITLTSDGEHSVTFLASGLKVDGGATLTIDGSITLNGGSEGNLLEAANGTLIVNGGTFTSQNTTAVYFDNASAVVRILGGTFNQSGSKYLISMGNAKEFTVGNDDGTGPSMNHSGTVPLINTVSNIDVSGAQYTIKGGTFKKTGSSGYIMQVTNSIAQTFTINGGAFNISTNAAMFAIRQNSNFVFNGGTFTSTAASEPLIYKVKGNITVAGGEFSSNSTSAIISTSTTASDAGSIVINDELDSDTDLTITQSGAGAIVEYKDAGSVDISNIDITRTGTDRVVVDITSTATGKVSISNANLSADYAVVSMPDKNGPVRLELKGNTVLTSKFDAAIFNGVKDTNYTMTGTDEIYESDDPMDGSDRILMISGKKSGDYVFVDQDLKLASNTSYTYTFNYRATGGGVPYIMVYFYYPDATGYSEDVKSTLSCVDTGTSMTFTFTTPELHASKNNVRIRLGNKADADATTGTVYYGNVSITKSDSVENLVVNGNFGWGLKKGWTAYNSEKVRNFSFIKNVNGFFSDEAVETIAKQNAYVFKGGDYRSFDFKVLLEAGATYQFSYLCRAVGDAPKFLYSDSDVIKVTEGSSVGYVKTYTITNTKASAVRVRFRLNYNYGSYGATAYVSNLKLYKLNGGAIEGSNMIADLNPIFGLSDAVRLNQDDSDAMNNLIGHGWFGAFKSDADGGSDDKGLGSDKYSKAVKVNDDFFMYLGQSLDIRNGIFGKIAYDSAYDVYLDGQYDVLDALIVKLELNGYYGADFQVKMLKNEILNTGDTTPTNSSKVYYVSNDGTDTNGAGTQAKPFKTLAYALGKASSGYTILLERGGQWYMPNNTNENAWLIENNNITIGAYTGNHGTAKPTLIGSVKNYAKDANWSNQGGNIWKMKMDYNDGANIPGAVYFFDNAEATQPTLVGTIINGDKDSGGKAFASTSELTKEGDVYRDYDARSDWLGGLWGGSKNNVYIYCEGNPNKYDRIYITESSDIFYAKGKENITIDNLCIKYVGAHGINFKGCENITVTNCEIGYIGGAPSSTTLGNGIQFGMKGNNLIADHNYVYQCYDAGITAQSWENDGDFRTNLNLTNVKITNNLLTNNFDNIELWNHNSGTIEIEISGNILKDAAYCWSYDQRPDGGNIRRYGCHVYGGRNAYNANVQITVNDNIFDTTKVNVFCWFWGDRDNAAELPQRFGEGSATGYMTFSSNIYYQEAGAYDDGQVMLYGNVGDQEVTYATSQEDFEAAVEQLDVSDNKFVRWVVTSNKKKNNYKEITINGTNIADFTIVNETNNTNAAFLVNEMVNAVSGEKLAISDSASTKAIKIVNDMALAPNTLKIYVKDNVLYIASYNGDFVYKSIAEFEKLLSMGMTEFNNGYEKVVTVSAVSYESVSGTKKLIGDSDKNAVGYSVGETATVNIAAYANGNILSVPYFRVKTYNESTGEKTDDYVSGVNGVYQLKLTSSNAGFVYWSVTACDSNKKVITSFSKVDTVDSLDLHYSGSVGFDVEDILKSSETPSDFEDNWKNAATEVKNTSATPTTIDLVASKDGYSNYYTYLVKLPIGKDPYGNQGYATGYLTYPKNATADSLGLKLTFQSNSVAVPDKNYDANAAVFTVCAHSLDIATALSDANYLSTFKSSIDKNKSNFAWDNTSFNDSYLVNMVKRDLLAGKFMVEHFTANDLWDGTTFIAKGTSMGGFQAIAVASLIDNVTNKKITTLDVSLPWLCDLGADASDNGPKNSTWRPNYAYADTVNFAPMLDNVDEIIINAGLGDAICPASGVMAFYNTIDNDNKTIIFRQNNTHSGGYDGKYFTIEE